MLMCMNILLVERKIDDEFFLVEWKNDDEFFISGVEKRQGVALYKMWPTITLNFFFCFVFF